MSEEPHRIRFEIEFEIWGNTLDFYKEKKAIEVMDWIMSRSTSHVGHDCHGRSERVVDLPEGVVPVMFIKGPKIMRDEK